MTSGNLLYYAFGWVLLFISLYVDFAIAGASWGYYALPSIGVFFFLIKFAIDWSQRER